MTGPSLLGLSTELRELIFKYVVVEAEPVQIHRTHPADSIESTTPPTLLRTSRLLRSEASVVYYSRNIFRIRTCFAANRSVSVLTQWLRILTPEDRALVKSVRLDYGSGQFPARNRLDWLERVRDHREALQGLEALTEGIEVAACNHRDEWVDVWADVEADGDDDAGRGNEGEGGQKDGDEKGDEDGYETHKADDEESSDGAEDGAETEDSEQDRDEVEDLDKEVERYFGVVDKPAGL